MVAKKVAQLGPDASGAEAKYALDMRRRKSEYRPVSAAALVPLHSLTQKGIARRATESQPLELKRTVDYRQLPTRALLNRCSPKMIYFDWTINPYRGCEYGCRYCYARYTHEYLERLDPAAFESEIYVKEWNERSFLHELGRAKPGHIVAIGTATDPYQPAERRFGLTRRILTAMTAVRGLRINLITKSDLIPRDIELFQTIAAHNELRIALTITTLDTALARDVEPMAPRPDLRLGAVRQLADAGLHVSVSMSPVLPGLTDAPDQLRDLAAAAKAAGAVKVYANVLFLKSSAKRVFLPWLRGRDAALAVHYESHYAGGNGFLRGAYVNRLSTRVEKIRQEFDLGGTSQVGQDPPSSLIHRPTQQLDLFQSNQALNSIAERPDVC